MTRQNLPPGGSFATAAGPAGAPFQKIIKQYQSVDFRKGHGTALA
jgi:hypothetical protein